MKYFVSRLRVQVSSIVFNTGGMVPLQGKKGKTSFTEIS